MATQTVLDGLEDEPETIDDSGLEIERGRDAEIEVPFDPTKIDIIVKAMTVSSLESRLENRELDLTPDFQRQANVWNAHRKARLIESVLLRIPLPSFYFSEDIDGSYAVVDGLQRLCALFHFMRPELLNRATKTQMSPLVLNGLQYLKELEGKRFSDLDRKFQRRIAEVEITANIIRASTPPAVKFNVFARLNQGGMPLNAQEIRNAIFPGVWRDHLREMAESAPFRTATEGKIKTERQQDIELVLRFVALWRLGPPFHRPAHQTLDEFLNATVEDKLTHWTDSDWIAVKEAFFRSLDICKQVFGRHVFRKSVSSERRKPINRGLFEAEMVVASEFSAEHARAVVANKQTVADEFRRAMLLDTEFEQALLYATGSASASTSRIKTLSGVFSKVIDGH